MRLSGQNRSFSTKSADISLFKEPSQLASRFSPLLDFGEKIVYSLLYAATQNQATNQMAYHTMKTIVSFLSLVFSATLTSHAQAQNIAVAEVNTIHLATSGTTDFHTVPLTLTSFTAPVVIAQLASYNDTAPAHVRLRNVGTWNFDMKIEEWNYLDGVHATSEEVGYMVFEAGVYTSVDRSKFAEAGTAMVDQRTAGAGVFTTVAFALPFSETPVLFAQVQTYNDPTPVVVRIRNVTTTGFDVLVQEEEAEDGAHLNETVGYLALITSQGESYNVSPFGYFESLGKYQAGIHQNVNESFSSISFSSVEFTLLDPIFFATMQTFNDPDPAGLRCRNLTTSGVEVLVEEEQSSNPEIVHANENVGYLAIEFLAFEYPASLLQ